MDSIKKNNSERPHYHVTAGLIQNSGKILITQRSHHDMFGGLWEFPGGKQEAGETLEQCLIREIAEELNIEIQVDEKLMSVWHEYDYFQINLEVFLCTLLKGTPETKAVADWKWINPAEIDQFDFTEADQKVIERLKELKYSSSKGFIHGIKRI